MIEKRLGLRLTPFTIALAYTLLGGIWVFFSDYLLAAYLTDPVHFQRSKIINAWVFIVLSSQLLYLLMRRREGAIQRSQDSLSRANRSLKVFSECNKVITWYSKEQELLKVICRIFVEVGGYRLAWVGFARQTPDKIVEPVAHWGHDDGYLQSLQVTWDDSRHGQGPAGSAIRTGKTTVVQNIMTQPEFRPWRDEALQNGYASAIALPLWNDHEVFGGLVILAAEADAFNQEEIGLLEELSADLSYAINGIRFHAEQNVVKEENRLLAAVIEQASDGVLIFEAAGTTLYINPAFEAICGTTKEAIGASVYTLDCCKMNSNFKRAMEETIRLGAGRSGRFLNQRADGGRYEVDVNIAPVQRLSDAETRYVAIMREVTHEVQLEKQLRSAQKMEAIATLSGGIAHDFNNILAAIITNTEMTLDDVGADNPLREHLQIVLKAGLRGKDLVKQILTISHQADQERQPVQVEKVVSECLLLLRASLPTTIEIRKVIADNLGPVPADPSQLHQVILNLCTNAADAMQDQDGILEVGLADIKISPKEAQFYPALHPGSYLKMTIKDTGHGMERAVMERIFDPFYTTKGRGKGTGLGLSVVHGIVKSHGGTLTVESEVGKGSVFEVFLPRIFCVEQPLAAPVVDLPARGGNERILLVDDEEDLVFAGKKMLERLGYDVVAGTDSSEMLKLFRADPHSFDLVITDQTMPHLTGEMLAREMLAVRADLPIILCSGMGVSGHSRVSLERARAVGIRELVTKPFEREEMTRVIRQLLD